MSNPREFWKCAQEFPANKEEVYPDHVRAQEFERIRYDSTVLEYGCGGGSDTLSYLRRGGRVVFADIVPSNVETTAKRVREAGYLSKGKPIVLVDSDKIPVMNEMFNIVSAHGVLHHIEDLSLVDRVLIEFRRVLKPGGRLYVMLYTMHLYNRYAAEIQELRGKDPSIHSWQEAFGHFTDGPGCPWATYYNVEEGYELFRRNGFKVESTVDYNDGDFRCYRSVIA